jgi:hypothetical protein
VPQAVKPLPQRINIEPFRMKPTRIDADTLIEWMAEADEQMPVVVRKWTRRDSYLYRQYFDRLLHQRFLLEAERNPELRSELNNLWIDYSGQLLGTECWHPGIDDFLRWKYNSAPD